MSQGEQSPAARTAPEPPELDKGIAEFITVIGSLDEYKGSTQEEKLAAVLEKHPVFFFSKTHCPFCLELKRTFTSLGVPFAVIEINANAEGAKLCSYARSQTKHKTVPAVYINKEFIGGCDTVKSLQAAGQLDPKIRHLVVRKEVEGVDFESITMAHVERGKARNPPFWFPNTVNNHVVRVTGILVVAVSAVGIAFRDDEWCHYLILFLMIDFITRMLVGSSLSMLGMLATLITSPLTPDIRAGPPKQFAAFCGTCFSATAAGCYLSDNPIPGACVLGALIGAAGLEGFANFCLGCVFFEFGVRFKIFPNYAYRIFANSQQETIDAWKYMHVSSNPARPTPVDTDPSSKIALKYKVKTDEWTIQDLSLIRNTPVSYFSVPLSVGGLAVAWKLASTFFDEWAFTLGFAPMATLDIPTIVYKSLGVTSAVIYAFLGVLYLVRLCLFHKKCRKEWQCPKRSGGFGMVTICPMLYAFLIIDIQESDEGEYQFARVMWWVGSMTHLLLTVIKFGEWVGKRLELEHVHSSWLILPVGNLVAALVCPIVKAIDAIHADPNAIAVFGASLSVELAAFFFSFAYFMWPILFTITLFKTVTTHNSDDRDRPLAFIWIAAPCVAGLSNLVICVARASDYPVPVPYSEQEVSLELAQCFPAFTHHFYIGCLLAAGLGWAFMPYIAYFGRIKFDMANWNYIFPLDTLAAAGVVYYNISGFRTGKALSITLLVIASLVNAIAALHTLSALVRRRGVFVPDLKWGPLSHMKLLHEGVRGALPRLSAALEDARVDRPASVQLLVALLKQLIIVHEEHAKHEEEAIFKTFNDYFHGHTKKFNDDHAADHITLERWSGMAAELLSSDASDETKEAHLKALREQIPPFVEHFLEHLQGEEDHLMPVGRKHIPLALQKDLTKKVWELTPATRWEVIIPFVINSLPRHQQRTRYLKALFWSLPERAQQIGAIVYRNCDAVMWERLAADVPEMVPRGEYNWWRYY